MLPMCMLSCLWTRLLVGCLIFLFVVANILNYNRACSYTSSLRSRRFRDISIKLKSESIPESLDDSIPKCSPCSVSTEETEEYYDNNNELENTSTSVFQEAVEENYLPDLLERCPDVPAGLGPVSEYSPTLAVEQLGTLYSDVATGGVYRPRDCKARQSVAIIVAYSGLNKFLMPFLYGLHPILIKQQLDYQIFVLQSSNSTHKRYNRGKLLNIGFKEALQHRRTGWNCIVFHELILPLDSRNLYRCSWYPRQLVNAVERVDKPSHNLTFGGAIAMTPEQFLNVNGFPNTYWENSADYYDLFKRINTSNYPVERNYYYDIGKYRSLKRSKLFNQKFEDITTPSPLYLLDGLTSLAYTVDSLELKRMYTSIQVNLNVDSTEIASVLDKQLSIQNTTQDTYTSISLNE